MKHKKAATLKNDVAEFKKHIESVIGNIPEFYLKPITRMGLKNGNQFTRKVISNLFVRQLKTKLLIKGNACQMTPY